MKSIQKKPASQVPAFVNDLDNSVSAIHYSRLDEEEKRMIDLIPDGYDRRISMNDLANLMAKDVRVIRRMVYHVIMIGVPIGIDPDSQHGGYFIITNEEERQLGTRTLVSRYKHAWKRLVALQAVDLDNWQQKVGLKDHDKSEVHD